MIPDLLLPQADLCRAFLMHYREEKSSTVCMRRLNRIELVKAIKFTAVLIKPNSSKTLLITPSPANNPNGKGEAVIKWYTKLKLLCEVFLA